MTNVFVELQNENIKKFNFKFKEIFYKTEYGNNILNRCKIKTWCNFMIISVALKYCVKISSMLLLLQVYDKNFIFVKK